MNKRIAIWAVAAIAVVAVLFLMQPPKPTGLVVGFFGECSGGAPNGICDAADPYTGFPAETYQSCPQDCCESDCTAKDDSVCHSACNNSAGCSGMVSACNGLDGNQATCANSSALATCCSAQTTCTIGTYCSNGSCNNQCSNTCDAVCQSSTCYNTDPDCSILGNPTRACCGNSRIEAPEECDKTNIPGTVTCVSLGYTGGTIGCTPQCTFDANGCTSVECVNNSGCSGGKICCNSSCVTTACDTNAACNIDGNPLTVDVCNKPGACDATCSRLCTARCAVDDGCNDNNSLTTDVCTNRGTCDANCTYTPTCSIRCDENSDCNDGLPLTFDICNNPNTCSSSCSNPACTAACSSNAGCNDNNSMTVDVCRNPGDCAARCINSTCRIDCDSNFDCNDNNALTIDTCINAGACNSSCSRTPCRVACTSDANCNDNNAMTIDACLNPNGCNAACSNSRQLLSIEFQVGFENVVVRGQTVDLTLMVKDESSNPVSDAVVSLTDSKGNKITLNSVGDGYYTGQYIVPSNSPLGTKRFSLSAASGGKTAYQELSLDVTEGNINVVLVQPTAFGVAVGQEVEIKFRLVFDNNVAVQGATVSAVLNGTAISLQSDSGVFTGKYLFSEKDAGQATLVINAVDTAGNSGTAAFAFNVVQPFPWFLVVLLLLLIIAIAVALYMFKKKRQEKQQGKWVFKKEED